MFDSKNANLIVWVLSAWLALVETGCGQEASGTEQAEPDSGRPLPRVGGLTHAEAEGKDGLR